RQRTCRHGIHNHVSVRRLISTASSHTKLNAFNVTKVLSNFYEQLRAFCLFHVRDPNYSGAWRLLNGPDRRRMKITHYNCVPAIPSIEEAGLIGSLCDDA